MSGLVDVVWGVVREVVVHVGSIVFPMARSVDGFLRRAGGEVFRVMSWLVSSEWDDRYDVIDLWYETWMGLIDGERYVVLRDLWIDEYLDRLNKMGRDHRVIDEMMVVGCG